MNSPGLNPALIAELETLIAKIAHKAINFTPREHKLMEMIRQNRDVILPQIQQMNELYKGNNPSGQEKIKNLTEGIEMICRRG